MMYLLLSGISFRASAQDGDTYFKNKDYSRAVFAYQREVASQPAKYLNLGKSYFALQEFDKAIEAFKSYQNNASETDKKMASQWISMLERNDEVVKVENIGGMVNDDKENFLPRILSDGKTLYFLSNGRSGGLGGEDIWYSTRDEKGNWQAPKNLSALNSTSHEGLLGISPDEKVAILFGNFKGSFGGGDLFYSVRTEDGWTPPCNLGGTINSSRWESLAAVGPDGKTLLYTTDMGNGKGSDIFVTFLSEEGWSTPKNLGLVVNSSGEEKFPFLAADGKTLYFSSKGHFGFGGYDMFVSRRLDDTWTNWSEPVNLGKYINTLDDDADLSIPASGKMAYVVRTDAPEGYGKSDIYQFLLPFSMRPEQVFTLYGNTYNEKDSAVEVNIRFYDAATGKEVAKATSKAPLGNYVANLPLNRKYLAVVDMKGYLYFSEEIDLTDPDKYRVKENFQKRIETQRSKLDALKQQMDALNRKLEELNASNSDKIKETYLEYEKLIKQYKQALDELDALIYKSKYDWMTKEDDDLSLKKDFHLRTITLGATFELKNIFFDVGKATLRPESIAELDKLYDIMKNSEIVIELGGHTDSTGTKEGNKKLSQERVNSVRKYLVDKGIEPKRLEAVGYGDEKPVATNTTDEGRQLNRRVEVKILKLQYDREGKDVVTDDDRKKKQEVPDKEIKKGDMLPILQAAARKGGLPSGSECNNITYVPKYTTPLPQKDVKPAPTGFWSKWVGDKDAIERKENIFKAFNASLINWEYNSYGLNASGASVILTNKNLSETHLEYFYSTESYERPGSELLGGVGFGYNYMYQLKPKLGIPLNLFTGADLKAFVWNDTTGTGNSDAMWNLNVPLKMRYIVASKKGGIVWAPEFGKSLGLLRSSDLLENKTGFWSFGATMRWKFLHVGAHLNRGQEIRFNAVRLGVSF